MVSALLIRGLKTLPLRMARHSENGLAISRFLETHPKVKHVFYPGLTSHCGHELAKKQMKNGFGGMVSFEMETSAAAKRVVEGVRLIHLAVSLGGVESLIEHPDSMTHGPMLMSEAERVEANISPGLVRMSVGLETADDLIADLKQALESEE